MQVLFKKDPLHCKRIEMELNNYGLYTFQFFQSKIYLRKHNIEELKIPKIVKRNLINI